MRTRLAAARAALRGALAGGGARDALRLGLQAAVAGSLAWLAARWTGALDPFLVILMAAGSLQRSVGGTVGEAWGRLQAAGAGSLLGLLGLAIAPEGWGTVGAVAVVLALVAGAAALRPALGLGMVPAMGLTLAGGERLADTVVASLGGIALGVTIGVAVSLAVWPDRAGARFERHFRAALRATAARLADAAGVATGHDPGPEARAHQDGWHAAVWLAGEALGKSHSARRAGQGARLAALRRLHDAVVVLERAAEGAGAADLEADVDALREGACAVLVALAEGRPGEVAAFDAALGRLGEAVAHEDPASEVHARHSAVAFGMREVRRSLAELVEAAA